MATAEESKIVHVPVLLNEVLELFSAYPGDKPELMLDGTFGRGGHSMAMLKHYPSLKVLGIDGDKAAIAYAQENFSAELKSGRLEVHHAAYSNFIADPVHRDKKFDFILLDLGVSSPQLDEAERGFSFYNDGPLDMRMNQNQQTTAATIINEWDEEDIIEVFKNYGEIFKPFRVVRAVVHDRKTKPFTTTRQLASLIERVEGWRHKGRHPATQYFMGLRLVINQELEHLQNGLVPMIQALVPGGVIAVITFHSLEDRIVKNIFKENASLGRRLNKKVIEASREEEQSNPRARSAKLRGFQRSGNDEQEND